MAGCPNGASSPGIGLRLGDVARLLVVWMVSSAALAIADVLLPT